MVAERLGRDAALRRNVRRRKKQRFLRHFSVRLPIFPVKKNRHSWGERYDPIIFIVLCRALHLGKMQLDEICEFDQLSHCWWLRQNHCDNYHPSGRIRTASAKVTLNGGSGRETPQNPLNLGSRPWKLTGPQKRNPDRLEKPGFFRGELSALQGCTRKWLIFPNFWPQKLAFLDPEPSWRVQRLYGKNIHSVRPLEETIFSNYSIHLEHLWSGEGRFQSNFLVNRDPYNSLI